MSNYDPFTHMLKLECDYKNLDEQKIPINKRVTRINKHARERAKAGTCHVCGKTCSSFCNSHSIPQFILEAISENGKVMQVLQGELPTSGNDTGIRQAGTFHLICERCDNTLFGNYENPDAYNGIPDNTMLAQITAKNYLHMIYKRKFENQLYTIMEEQFENFQSIPFEGKTVEEIDIQEYEAKLNYALHSLEKGSSNSYYLAFHRVLDYVVPYAVQTPVALISDLDGQLVNNVYNFSENYHIRDLQIAIFPMNGFSVIILFIENGEKRYRKFFRQLKKLDEEDQLAVINYLVFSYTENVFFHPSTYRIVMQDKAFMNVCDKSTISTSEIGIPNSLDAALKNFDFSERFQIPNLLGRNFALNTDG